MVDKLLTKQFGILLRQLRLEKGWSQETFADRCGLHRTYVGSIERGEKSITIETLQRLTIALNTKPSIIFQRLEANNE